MTGGAPRDRPPGAPSARHDGRWLAAGATLALLLGLPSLIYQASHGWPQLRMAAALVEHSVVPNRLLVLPGQLVLVGLPLVPVWWAGLVGLLRVPSWRSIRCLGIAHLAVVGIVLVADGRMDYAAATLIPMLAAGCVRLDAWSRTPRGARALLAALTVNAAISAVVALPLLPVDLVQRTPLPALNPLMRGSVGWRQFASEVALAYGRLAPDERRDAILLAHDFAQAGALDRFGPSLDLPPVYSGHNELARKRPPERSGTVLAVGVDPSILRRVFDRCDVIGYVDAGDVPGQSRSPLTLCQGRRISWRTAWPAFVHVR